VINQQLQYDFLVALNRYIKKVNNSSYSPIVGITAKEDGELKMILKKNSYHYVTRQMNAIAQMAHQNTNCHLNIVSKHRHLLRLEAEGVNPAPYRKSWEHIRLGRDWFVELAIKFPSEVSLINLMNNLIAETPRTK